MKIIIFCTLAFTFTYLGSVFAEEVDTKNNGYKTIEWFELIPEAEAEILSTIDLIIDHTGKTNPLDDGIYKQALTSTNVIPEMDGRLVRIAGFVVPLEFTDKTITQFLLVPFFGACIHVPPPPPNQIILVDYPKGVKEGRNMDSPVWITGKIETSLLENNMATTAYYLQADAVKEYF